MLDFNGPTSYEAFLNSLLSWFTLFSCSMRVCHTSAVIEVSAATVCESVGYVTRDSWPSTAGLLGADSGSWLTLSDFGATCVWTFLN